MVEVSLKMIAAGEIEFRQRVGNQLAETKADCEAAAVAIYCAMERARPQAPASDVVERLKGELYFDLLEQRNPGIDEFAKGFNGGIVAARNTIYAKLHKLLAALSTPASDPDVGRMREAVPIFERVTRLADTLASDVPITAEARKHIERAYNALAALTTAPEQKGDGR